MSSPENFSRENYDSQPLIKVRYRGECRNYGTTTQSTPRKTAESKQKYAWIRCRDCGTITRCPKSDSSHADGAVAGDSL
ncbi:hypothetical protein [Natronorubrum thiooxidans]|uniref:Uncharacterized protein n=1 Tax=Natronorubrum thiooxidans TaxID=308853 RepID=A0A1N7HAE4_9EURY|nr:hypothetical protein [Natronorubrum thiooxidans]SIS21721.1 hypothetical protein SAMN05421752_1404 [Natronorubrum thiooxidans]